MNNQNNKTAYANHNIEKRFLEAAETFHGTFQSFRPFPKASMQTSYETLPESLKEKLIQAGEEKLNYSFPVIRATDYMRFKRYGDCVAFEVLYFDKPATTAAVKKVPSTITIVTLGCACTGHDSA